MNPSQDALFKQLLDAMMAGQAQGATHHQPPAFPGGAAPPAFPSNPFPAFPGAPSSPTATFPGAPGSQLPGFPGAPGPGSTAPGFPGAPSQLPPNPLSLLFGPMGAGIFNQRPEQKAEESKLDTSIWGVGDGKPPTGPLSACMFIFYGIIYPRDWGSMNIDSQQLLAYAVDNKIDVAALTTNNHDKVTRETVLPDKRSFRAAVQKFFREEGSKYKDLIFTVASHGEPYEYRDGQGRMIQGQAIVIGKDPWNKQDILYTDQELMEDINNYLPEDTFLYLVIDTCFSGGILNLWQFKDRLDKNVILFSASNSEIMGYGTFAGGFLTRYFVAHAKPGRYACKIADDILRDIEVKEQRSVQGVISTQIKYSRPGLALAPFLNEF